MPDDDLTAAPHGANARADTATRLAMYRCALRIRMVEEEIVTRYPEQEMRCPTHICIGQEGVPAGVSAHLRPLDAVFSAHRSHGHYLAKGSDLRGMIAELYGRETGCALGRGGSQHLVDLDAGFIGSAPILASTISVGVGHAWAAKRLGEDRIVAIYFGDGATEEGAFHEAMNFAGVNKLPVLFICENNLYSVHSKLDMRQPLGRKVHELGSVHGVRGLFGDGNDMDAVWRLAEQAVAHVRGGNGPVIVEFMTYRWKEHCGPNEDLSLEYRSREEFDAWVDRDPVETFKQRLIEEGVLSDRVDNAYRSEIAEEIRSVFEFSKASAFPSPDTLFEFVYPDRNTAP